MGSEVSTEDNNIHRNGDIKKDDDLDGNFSETSENIDKESKPTQREKHHNGDVRNRKTGKGASKAKVDLKKSLLKAKPPSRKDQHKSFLSKWLAVVNGTANATSKASWLLKLMAFSCAVGVAFATRLFNVTLPPHIW